MHNHNIFNEERRHIIQIYLDKKITEDLSISKEAVAVYCILRNILRQGQSNYVITANQLLHQATTKVKYSAFDKDCFLRGLSELCQKNIISVTHVFNNSEKEINLSNLEIKKGNDIKFTSIELSEIQAILNGCGTNRYSILRYFILLIGTFNPSITVYLSECDSAARIISTMPIDYLAKLSGLSKATIMTYNKQLEDLKLLYIYHAADYYHTDTHRIKSPSNVYGRYCDKAYVDKYVQNDAQYRGYAKYEVSGKIDANHKRRLAQRCNRILSGLGKYSDEEIKEVYDYVLRENKRFIDMYEKSKWEPFRDKLRDVSILENILEKGNFK